MPHYRIAEAASLLGVSDDTVRRWVEAGRLEAVRVEGGRAVVEGTSLARLAREHATAPRPGTTAGTSARNRFVGIVTRVVADGVMAQVDLQAGPFRLVSLMSREAVEDLGLEEGATAVATVKATNVVVEVPR